MPKKKKKSTLKRGKYREVVFSTNDCSKEPLYQLDFNVNLTGDETSANNQLVQTISNEKTVLGKLTKWEKLPNGIELQSGMTKLKVLFYKDDIFRVLLSPDGNYTNPAGNDIVIDGKIYQPSLKITEDANAIYIASKAGKLQIQKNPILFTLYDSTGKVLWAKKEPLTFG